MKASWILTTTLLLLGTSRLSAADIELTETLQLPESHAIGWVNAWVRANPAAGGQRAWDGVLDEAQWGTPAPQQLVSRNWIFTLTDDQWRAAVQQKGEGKREEVKFDLWLPGDIPHARGIVVMSGHGSGEALFRHPELRAIARQLHLALFKFLGNPMQRGFWPRSLLYERLKAFGVKSGHAELEHAPLFLYGHSNGTGFSAIFPATEGARVWAWVSMRPGITFQVYQPDAAQVPGLVIFGEDDQFFARPSQAENLAVVPLLRKKYHALWNIAVEPKTGHGPTEKTWPLVFSFLRHTFAARVPADADPRRGPMKLTVPTEESGYLGQNWNPAQGGYQSLAVASYATFPGDKATASWLVNAAYAADWQTFQRTGAVAAPQRTSDGKLPGGPTGVTFKTAQADLQRLYDVAEAQAARNIVQFTPTMQVLVEGGGYSNAWIETQPMGGEMYAPRNLEVALNNQRVFLLGQRSDGRLPGMVVSGSVALKRGWDRKPPEGYIWLPQQNIAADFEMFQGYCFPEPAWRMYFWTGKDRSYLRQLYFALAAHDAYLWKTRDSNGDGLLETWCVYDTGEDHCTRLLTRGAPTRWPFDVPPSGEHLLDPQDPANYKKYWIESYHEKLPPPSRDEVRVPFASMDVMSYSYSGRATLAKISRELGNGREAFWRAQADEVRRRVIEKLWDPARHACFDRDRTGRRLDELIHNNLRCMWYGLFTPELADAFIKHHLLNPAEFWTPVPLPSIAVNDPLYRNTEGNSWSGQPQGLTYQRAIGALENYGHYAEVTLLGKKLLPVVIRNGCKFTQQFDPQTGKPSGPKDDGYGPTILAVLEYLSRMHGIHLDVERGEVWWSALDATQFSSSQRWGQRTWSLSVDKGHMTAQLNGRELLRCTVGARVVTDLEGRVRSIVGCAPTPQAIVLDAAGTQSKLAVKPNEVWRPDAARPILVRAGAFDYPHDD